MKVEKIKPEELRIGNVIGWAHEESVSELVVTAKDIADLEYINMRPDDPEERFARGIWYVPIFLSPDILERYGFVKSENRYSSSGYFYTLVIPQKDENGFRDDIRFASEGTWVKVVAMQNVKFHYLHQLQNIFYALTGSELSHKQD